MTRRTLIKPRSRRAEAAPQAWYGTERPSSLNVLRAPLPADHGPTSHMFTYDLAPGQRVDVSEVVGSLKGPDYLGRIHRVVTAVQGPTSLVIGTEIVASTGVKLAHGSDATA